MQATQRRYEYYQREQKLRNEWNGEDNSQIQLIELLKKTQGEMLLGIKNSAIWIKSSVDWEKFQALY